jgi:hypothetical protein
MLNFSFAINSTPAAAYSISEETTFIHPSPKHKNVLRA